MDYEAIEDMVHTMTKKEAINALKLLLYMATANEHARVGITNTLIDVLKP